MLGSKHDREVGVLDSRVGDLKEDVDGLGTEVRKTRHENRELITKMEARLIKEMEKTAAAEREHNDSEVAALKDRWDRMLKWLQWLGGVSVPAIGILVGLLIGKA